MNATQFADAQRLRFDEIQFRFFFGEIENEQTFCQMHWPNGFWKNKQKEEMPHEGIEPMWLNVSMSNLNEI